MAVAEDDNKGANSGDKVAASQGGSRWSKLPRRPLLLFGMVTAAVAAITGFGSNIDKIVGWINKASERYEHAPVAMNVAFQADPSVVVTVIVRKEGQKYPVDQKPIRGGGSAELSVPSGDTYSLIWQGIGIKPGGTSQDILIDQANRALRLSETGREGGALVLELAWQDVSTQQPLPTGAASADVLLSAAATADEPGQSGAPPPSASSLPELDRAAAIVGLFETGTTNCARGVWVIGGVPSVGCLAVPLGRLLKPLLEEGITQAVVGGLTPAEIELAREIAAQEPTDFQPSIPAEKKAELQAVSEKLIALPEIRMAYQQELMRYYGLALQKARELCIPSERGALLVFDRMIHQGPGAVSRAEPRIRDELAAHPQSGEADRIRIIGRTLLASSRMPASIRPFVNARVETITTGKGIIRGVEFDLSAIGIPPLSEGHPCTLPAQEAG